MINLRPLKDEAGKFPEPVRTVLDLTPDRMPQQDFLVEFFALRKKARELDREVQK